MLISLLTSDLELSCYWSVKFWPLTWSNKLWIMWYLPRFVNISRTWAGWCFDDPKKLKEERDECRFEDRGKRTCIVLTQGRRCSVTKYLTLSCILCHNHPYHPDPSSHGLQLYNERCSHVLSLLSFLHLMSRYGLNIFGFLLHKFHPSNTWIYHDIDSI